MELIHCKGTFYVVSQGKCKTDGVEKASKSLAQELGLLHQARHRPRVSLVTGRSGPLRHGYYLRVTA